MQNAHEQKTLGFWMLTALVVGNAVGSGVFLLPASLAKIGSISIVGWTLTAVGTIFLALVFARLSRLIPKTGGPYVYCHEVYGDFIGFQVAYNYWIGLWVGNAAIAVAFVAYLSVFWPAAASNPAISSSLTIGLVWVLTFINMLGVREAGVVQLVTAILKLIPLFAIAFLGLFYIKPGYLTAYNVSGHSDFSAISTAATLTLWSFIGFESATVPAGSVINPEKNIPRATIVGTLMATFVYILGTTTVMGIIPMKQLAHSASPFAQAAQLVLGHYGELIIASAAVIACLGTLNGWILLQGQIPFAAAKDNLFPEAFGRLSKTGTPYVGLIVSSVLITALLLMRYGANLVDEFTFIITLAVLAMLIPYLLTAVAEVMLYINQPEKFSPKRMASSVVLSIFAFSYAFWVIYGAGQEVVFYGTLLFFSGVPIYVWMKWRSAPKRVEA